MSVLAFVDKNQVPITRNLLMVLYASNFIGAKYNVSRLHKHSSRFLHLLYAMEKENGKTVYDIGAYDAYYVAYWVVLLIFMRAIFMQHVFDPIAKHVFVIKSRKARVRFAEQSWWLVYYLASFALGLYLYYHSPYYNNIDNIFVGWPHDRMSALFKKYYLISTACWLQQVLVLNIELRRKDHYQMFCHHIVTCILVIGSYYYYFSRIGNLILIIMDSVDIFLSSAKVLKYSRFNTACDAMFVLFLIAWIILRHGVYNYLFYIAWSRLASLMSASKCGLVQSTLKRCWTRPILNWFLALLGGLQIIQLFWLWMIFRVILKFARGDNAEDVRSDDNDTDIENGEHKQESENKKGTSMTEKDVKEVKGVKQGTDDFVGEITEEVIEVQAGSGRN